MVLLGGKVVHMAASAAVATWLGRPTTAALPLRGMALASKRTCCDDPLER